LKRAFSSLNYKDYYGLLGLSSDATVEEINAAYKALALKYHTGFTQGSTNLDQEEANVDFE